VGTGQPQETKTSTSPRRLLLPLLGAVVAAAAWAALVVLAVDLGRDASGVSSWAGAVVATLAAVVCMLVVFALLAHAWAILHGVEPARRTPGHRRR
jgi:hypothetical protein